MEDDKREKALQAISKDPNRIIKTNPIINAKFDITTVQMKVFLKIIASVDQSKNDVTEVQISVSELQKFVGKTSKNIHRYLQDELIKLKQRNISYEDENIRLDTNILSSIIYHKKKGEFTFEIPKALKPFLLQIKENFTVLDIRNMLFLESIYSMRFYEYCKEFERFKTFELGIEELKDRFGLINRYKNYFDFKLKVINQAREELMNSSELYFDYEEIKEGKKVVRLRFTIIKNSSKEKKELEYFDKELEQDILLIHEIVKPFVSLSTVKLWFEKLEKEQIERRVAYTMSQLKKSEIKDVGAYLQKMMNTSEFIDPIEVKALEQKVNREREAQIQDRKQKMLDIQAMRDKLKGEFYEAQKMLSLKLLTKDDNLYKDILSLLKKENELEDKSFLSEMAYINYKVDVNSERDEKETFIYNFEQGGSFTSYVFECLKHMFQTDFRNLKKGFENKATSLGMKEDELF